MPEIMECHRSAWAVREEMLPVFGAVMTGRFDGLVKAAQERYNAASAAGPGGQQLTGGVAILSLTGVLTPQGSFISMLFGGGAGGLQGFRADFREALAADEIAAIVIDIDSPGGLVDLVPETAAEIRNARGAKPIVAVANTLAASGAYWIGAQADEIVVTPSGSIGSIGVYAVHDDWSKFNEDFGVTPTYVSAGKYKVERNPDTPLSDEAEAAMQATIDELYGMFVADVAAGRGTTPDAVTGGYGEGRVVTASRALQLGMADRIDTLEATIARLVGAPSVDAAAVAQALARRADEAPSPAPARREPEPAASDDHETEPAEPAEQTSPPRGGGDPEQKARVTDLLLA